MEPSGFAKFRKECDKLSTGDVDLILEEGRQWDLEGASALFPHAFIRQCGAQIAAVVHNCLNSGADRVLCVGVLHRFLISPDTPPGIYRDCPWEYSLDRFTFLCQEECKRRAVKMPKLVLRYPHKIDERPEVLDELERDCFVVATADLCHHGAVYGDNPILKDPKGYARWAVERGVEEGPSHHQKVHSDGADVCATLRHLLGPIRGEVVDLRIIDTGPLYPTSPQPAWVAASLLKLQSL